MPKISSRVILVLAVLAVLAVLGVLGMFALYMRAMYVSTADKVCTPPTSLQLPVTLNGQETDNLCWAASAQMVKTFVFEKVHPGQNPQFSQCAEASKANGAVDCCADPMPAVCDVPGWPNFGAPDFSTKDTWAPGPPPEPPSPVTPLTWETISQEIGCAGRPFVFAWTDVGGGGHIVVVVGYSGANGAKGVLINDPLPQGKGTFYGESYDWYAGQAANANAHWRDFYAIEYIGP